MDPERDQEPFDSPPRMGVAVIPYRPESIAGVLAVAVGLLTFIGISHSETESECAVMWVAFLVAVIVFCGAMFLLDRK